MSENRALLEVSDLIKHYPVRAGLLRRQSGRERSRGRSRREPRQCARMTRRSGRQPAASLAPRRRRM